VYTPYVIVTAFADQEPTLLRTKILAKPTPINGTDTNCSGTLAELSSSSKLSSVQRTLNFCLPAAAAALASKWNVPECSAK